MESPDTFTLLSLSIDPSTKAVSSPSAALETELDRLNSTHRGLVKLDTPGQVPGPPLPVQPQRSQQIGKLRESAQAALKKKASTAGSNSSDIAPHVSEAIKLFTLAADMALSRPQWEPSGLMREEAAVCFAGRAEAYGAARQWADSLVDARLSVECKRAGNCSAYARGGRALIEMGRREEAKEFVRTGYNGEEVALSSAIGQFNQFKAQIAQAHQQGQQIPPQALAQGQQIENAVAKQTEAMKELAALLKELGVEKASTV